MFIIISITVLIVLLLIPIPIKVSAIYNNRLLAIKIYNYKINLQSKSQVERNAKKTLAMDIHIKPIIDFLQKNRFKPALKLKLKLAYGFGDAAYTGIFYGIINIIYPFFLELFKNIMEIKKSEFIVNPDFDKSIFNFEFKSIIFASLVQVIYMTVKILNIVRKNHIYKIF